MTEGTETSIFSPLEGELIPLSEVEDDVFSSGAMGQGAAVIPTEGKIVAPFDGKVSAVFPTKHAIGLIDEHGIEVLIHIGMNTVELNGKYFISHVENNQEVKKGDELTTFDVKAIKEAGYPIVTPIIVTNTTDFKQVASEKSQYIKKGDKIVTVVK